MVSHTVTPVKATNAIITTNNAPKVPKLSNMYGACRANSMRPNTSKKYFCMPFLKNRPDIITATPKATLIPKLREPSVEPSTSVGK